MTQRLKFSAEAKVALEALVGDKTLSELAAKHSVHPNGVTPVWWTSRYLGKEDVPCQGLTRRSRQSSAAKWSSWCGQDVHRMS